MSENEGKRPVWRPTENFPMPDPLMPIEPPPHPVPRWVGWLGRMIALTVLVLMGALLIAPLVWAVRQAWGWALG